MESDGDINEEPKLSMEQQLINSARNLIFRRKKHAKSMLKSHLKSNAGFGYMCGALLIPSYLFGHEVLHSVFYGILLSIAINGILIMTLRSWISYTLEYAEKHVEEAYDEDEMIYYGNHLQGKSNVED